jgi:sulfur relay (sulfurtransferase) DsrF/TusC family protein
MPKKILQVIDQAYRCTAEEQDDPVLWITAAMRGAGADLHVLLRGNGVCYATLGQDAGGVAIGGRAQTQPPRLDRDVAKLIDGGATVFVVEDDVAERGLERTDLVAGVEPVPRARLARLYEEFAEVWHW